MWPSTKLSILSKQCLDRRIPTIEELHQELSAWNQERNQTANKVIWYFSTDEEEVKLQHLYPVFDTPER